MKPSKAGLLGLFLIWPLMITATGPERIEIVDSGSTNSAGIRVAITEGNETATVKPRSGPEWQVKLTKALCDRLRKDVEAAMPLDRIPVNRCLKSASFGSRQWIEADGLQSGDLSCPVQANPLAASLKRDAGEILNLAKSFRQTTFR